MNTLYIITLNGRSYLTTDSGEAWAFCLCFDCDVTTAQTPREIPAVEYQEESMESVYVQLKDALRSALNHDWINAEWSSDPMSVQCFDLRIVEDVRKLIADPDGDDADMTDNKLNP